MYPKARRRLAQWVDEQGVTQYGIRIKPFWLEGGTYGYASPDPKDEALAIGETIGGGLLTLGNFIAALAVDVPGSLALVPFSIIASFFLHEDFTPRRFSNGISGIFNIFAGYLAYNAAFDKNAQKVWLPLVGASGTMLSNLMALQEPEGEVNNFAHFVGYLQGFLFGWLVNRFWRKKTSGVAFIRRNDLIIMLFIFISQAIHFDELIKWSNWDLGNIQKYVTVHNTISQGGYDPMLPENAPLWEMYQRLGETVREELDENS